MALGTCNVTNNKSVTFSQREKLESKSPGFNLCVD